MGASGSIGTQTIDVVEQHHDDLSIIGMAVGRRTETLEKHLAHHRLPYACVEMPDDARRLAARYPHTVFFCGDEGLLHLCAVRDYDLAVNALQGFVGLRPTLEVIKSGRDVALANKETLVAGGSLVTAAAKRHKVSILPIDSEHSAIWQCMRGGRRKEVRRLIITASGGALRQLTRDQLPHVTVQQALCHPTWSMGAKITIDCATMMNKGFEVIEAHWLFGLGYDRIDVVLHPQSIIHSMVEFDDHAVLAQMGVSDMRIPIQYALSYPQRWPDDTASLDLTAIGTLAFSAMDMVRYPLLKLAYDVGRKGGNLPAVMNGANETAVRLFLDGNIGLLDIEKAIFAAVDQAGFIEHPDLADIIAADGWAHEFVMNGCWKRTETIK